MIWLIAGLIARDGDLAPRGLADAVDLAAALADDIAVCLRVGQDQVACVAVLGGLLDRRQERCLCLGYVLGRAAQDPRDVSVYGRVCGVDHGPREEAIGSVCVVSNQGQSSVCSCVCWRSGLGGNLLTSVINRDLMLISHLAEELAIFRDGVVDSLGNLDGLPLLFLHKTEDMSLGLLNVRRQADDLNAALATALPWDIDRDAQLRLELLLGFASASNQGAVLVRRNVDKLRCLAVALGNDLLYRCDDIVDNILLSFNLDEISVRLCFRELDRPREVSAIVRTTSLDNDVPESGA